MRNSNQSHSRYAHAKRRAYTPRHASQNAAPNTSSPDSASLPRSASPNQDVRPFATISADQLSRSAGVRAYTSRKKPKHKHTKLKIAAGILTAVLVSIIVVVAWYINDINQRLGEGISDEVRAQLTDVSDQEPFYMLLLGVDKNQDRAEDWGDDTSNFRSDTIILARVAPKEKRLTLISIPRDTLVDMGENGSQKINAAYSIGGSSYMLKVVSELAGVSISHVAEIDFEQFTKVVDTIGGIEVNLPIPISDMQYANIDLPAGVQTLNGAQALGLVRTRHAYDEYGAGDFYRAANQRMVISAILKKVLKLDPASITSTISDLAESVTTDMNVGDLMSLALAFKDFDAATNMYSALAPTRSEYINGISYEILETSAWQEMLTLLKRGEDPSAASPLDEIISQVTASTTTEEIDISEVEPQQSGSVLVLNGTDISGLAMNRANMLIRRGFTATADAASRTDYKQTTIYYNAARKNAAAVARGVADNLQIDISRIQQNDGSLSTDYDVVVILGSDQDN